MPARARKWMRPWVLAAVALAVVLVAAIAFFRQQQPGPPANAYVIAFAGALTGTDAAVGNEQLRAVELAADTVNAAGGIGGRPLAIVSYDDANDPARAAEVAREIVADDRVVLVIGHTIIGTSLAAAPIYEAAGLPAISPSVTADVLTANDPWYFRSIFTNHKEGQLIAAYSQDVLGYERASIISLVEQYPSSLVTAFADRFGQEGTVVARWKIDPANLDASVATVVAALQTAERSGDRLGCLAAERSAGAAAGTRTGRRDRADDRRR